MNMQILTASCPNGKLEQEKVKQSVPESQGGIENKEHASSLFGNGEGYAQFESKVISTYH